MELARTANSAEKKREVEEDDDQDVMLPGYRFHPTDEELVGFYLRRKVEKKPLSIELIKQIDIYKYDPWDLPKVSIGDKEWYFFCMRGRKYRNSVRPNRVTGSGFWKATGIDRPIYSLIPHSQDCIGLKKSLVYYRGSAGKGIKTDWMMHEFRLPPNNGKDPHNAKNNIAQEAEVWTLCRIFKRIPTYKKYTPDLKDTKPTKQNPIISTDSGSKTCSLESDNNNCEQYLSFGDSLTLIKQNQTKMMLNHQQQMLINSHMNMMSSRPQAPPLMTSAYLPSLWNIPNGNGSSDDFFRDGNWDELRSVVDLANMDSSILYDCRGRY